MKNGFESKWVPISDSYCTTLDFFVYCTWVSIVFCSEKFEAGRTNLIQFEPSSSETSSRDSDPSSARIKSRNFCPPPVQLKNSSKKLSCNNNTNSRGRLAQRERVCLQIQISEFDSAWRCSIWIFLSRPWQIKIRDFDLFWKTFLYSATKKIGQCHLLEESGLYTLTLSKRDHVDLSK